MTRRFKVNSPFDCAMKLLIPTETKIKGVVKKVYIDPVENIFEYPFVINKNNPVEFSKQTSYLESLPVFFGSFRSYGGTENFSNGIYTVYHTAVIETWFNPEISTECQIYICETGEIYNVITVPENIDMRHQFLQFKVEKVGGKT